MRDDDAPTGSDLAETRKRTQREHGYMAALGQRIRIVREEHGLTQQALARAAGIATDMVSRLENGHYTSPGLRTILRIADALSVTVGVLLPDSPVAGASPEAVLRGRVTGIAARLDPEGLELLNDLAAVVARHRPT